MAYLDGQLGWMKTHLGICEVLLWGFSVPETDQEGSV